MKAAPEVSKVLFVTRTLILAAADCEDIRTRIAHAEGEGWIFKSLQHSMVSHVAQGCSRVIERFVAILQRQQEQS